MILAPATGLSCRPIRSDFMVEGSKTASCCSKAKHLYDFCLSNGCSDAQGGRNAEMAKLFIEHYRKATRFVLSHPYSLATVPVLYEQLNEYTPVFNQYTDAILFRSAVDSLKTVYPESPYVKALEAETVRRENQFQLKNRIDQAGEQDYPELNLPGMDGNPVSLSGIDAKVILLHFWDPSSAEQKMFNLDVLKPLYERWHKRGLEIYAVGVSTDKPLWASVVNLQQLPWINVCDGNGPYSPLSAFMALAICRAASCWARE